MVYKKSKEEINKFYMISLGLLFLSLIFALQVNTYDYGSGNLSLLSNQNSSEHEQTIQIKDLTSLTPKELPFALADLKDNDIFKARISLNNPISIGYFPNDNSDLDFLVFSKVNIENISNNGFLMMIASGDSANVAENDLGSGQVVEVLIQAKRNAVAATQSELPSYKREESLKQLRILYQNKIAEDIYFELYADTPDNTFAKLIADSKSSGNAIYLYLASIFGFLSFAVFIYAIYNSQLLSMPTARARNFGASLVEFGLIVALIALVALIGVRRTGLELNCTFTGTANSLGGNHGAYTLLIPAAGGFGAAIANLQGCCNKHTNMGFFESMTPTDGYYHASCSFM